MIALPANQAMPKPVSITPKPVLRFSEGTTSDRYKILHPMAWVLERLISTPATHHAHHAATADDGVGYYKGNFGNMFFLWDVIFGTALISRQYPQTYGISHYEGDSWYAQFLWPVFKSRVAGSELAAEGPMVRVDAAASRLAASSPAWRTTRSAPWPPQPTGGPEDEDFFFDVS